MRLTEQSEDDDGVQSLFIGDDLVQVAVEPLVDGLDGTNDLVRSRVTERGVGNDREHDADDPELRHPAQLARLSVRAHRPRNEPRDIFGSRQERRSTELNLTGAAFDGAQQPCRPPADADQRRVGDLSRLKRNDDFTRSRRSNPRQLLDGGTIDHDIPAIIDAADKQRPDRTGREDGAEA